MDWVLFTLSAISLAAAAGFGVIAWRLLREERRRSAARVAALGAAIDGASDELRMTIDSLPTENPSVGPGNTQERSIFAAPGIRLQGQPLVKAAAVAVLAVIVISAVLIGGGDRDAGSAVTTPQQAPLELMSMRHTREGATLTVAGLVRNPSAGVEARRVSAVVFAFDGNGSFLASGRAPLDFVVLEPGGESPFVVTVPEVADVARYRVSFRTEDGVVRHVDRRAERMQLAQQ